MKFLHLADLHLGKRLHGFSLIEDQRYIWQEILTIIDTQKPDAVLFAGDIYDKPIPPLDAVQLFDAILASLAERNLTVLLIAGNHDSPERIACGGRVMQIGGVYIAPVFDGTLSPITLQDAYGEIDCYLLPFIRPANVRPYYPDTEIADYQDAVQTVLAHTPLRSANRNLMITHQFVAGASLYGTEERAIGGTDQICAELFTPFDYTALGHLHRPQTVGTATIRYAGSPLKYSIAEAAHEKTVTFVTFLEKGTVQIQEIPLHPLHDLRIIRGTYMELTARSYYQNIAADDYLHVILTDETDVPDAIGKLRAIYPNLLDLEYDNLRTQSKQPITSLQDVAKKTPYDYFNALYTQQNNQPMDKAQTALLQQFISEIWEGQL